MRDDKKRKEEMDYYGTAMMNGFPMAVLDLVKAEQMPPDDDDGEEDDDDEEI